VGEGVHPGISGRSPRLPVQRWKYSPLLFFSVDASPFSSIPRSDNASSWVSASPTARERDRGGQKYGSNESQEVCGHRQPP
jgi:hypothetical protein